jgi:hypothetical protein
MQRTSFRAQKKGRKISHRREKKRFAPPMAEDYPLCYNHNRHKRTRPIRNDLKKSRESRKTKSVKKPQGRDTGGKANPLRTKSASSPVSLAERPLSALISAASGKQ